MLGQVESTLQGVRVVKSARAERFERRRYGEIMNEIRRQQIKLSKYEAFTTPAMEVTALFAMGAILMLASWMMFEKQWLDKTSFIAIMFALGTIAEPLRRLSKLNNVIQRASAAAARMFQIVDVPAERERSRESAVRNEEPTPVDVRPDFAPTSRVVLPPLQNEIVFDDVSFSYPNSNLLALERVTLRVPKGQSVAVVGRNGSGKTTLLALLPRFYDPNGGAVLIDGVDLRQATLRSLRKQIALVTQDSVIFSGTIAQNIAYGHPLARNLSTDIPEAAKASASMNDLRIEIESAAKRAFAHDFIIAKPQGYDTVLDGLGSQLSGGQKQRLCIARAILRKAPILILDEATSQVDAESEHLIQQAIESLMHEATTFVIAHRFSTILSADVIVVMDNGRIVGQGRHDELLKTCEVYQQLYERQMIGAPS
jgi:ABC-type multidrug transport system fused ATPase/permease subunit